MNQGLKLIKMPKLYIGQIPDDGEEAYCRFYDDVWAYRAMFSRLRVMLSLQYDTLEKILKRWLPMRSEEAEKLIAFIVYNTNISRGERLKAGDRENLIRIVSGIAHYQTGEIPDEREVLKAYEMTDVRLFE